MTMQLMGQGGQTLQLDGSYRATRTSVLPEDFEYRGSYQLAASSGTIAASLSGNFFAMNMSDPTGILHLERISVQGFQVAASAALSIWQLQISKFWNSQVAEGAGAAGTAIFPTREQTYKRVTREARISHAPGYTSYAPVLFRIAAAAAIGAGTRELDPRPFGFVQTVMGIVANTPLFASGHSVDLYQWEPGMYPMIFQTNEGFIVTAPTAGPALATYILTFTVEWSEYDNFAAIPTT